jgi:hypothetical protein
MEILSVGIKKAETKPGRDQVVGSRAASLPAKNAQKLESR